VPRRVVDGPVGVLEEDERGWPLALPPLPHDAGEMVGVRRAGLANLPSMVVNRGRVRKPGKTNADVADGGREARRVPGKIDVRRRR
jgi:hypothetical protein